MSTYYVTTPIYYVNDRPHVGHCYSTLVADVAARFQRLFGRDVFFLTGTDEHAEKVVERAAANGVTPQQWADKNAAEFERAFAMMGCASSDFIRTTQRRHIEKVEQYIARMLTQGDVYLGEYEGWFDESQEEYVTETTAKEHGYKSPVTGRELVKRVEKNYFFRLSAYEGRLKAYLEANEDFVLPEARRNEVLGRLRDGLNDVPISRAVTGDAASRWGILMPGDPGHRVYVWIDALFNYLSVVDTPGRRGFWPPAVHVLAKDILWFHAVIWPCMLMALGEGLPRTVYAHAYWVREGRKMSKSLGNFVDLGVLRAYIDRYTLDALRWFLVTQGPQNATDTDFAHGKFVEVYNADLANGIGNATSRVSNMIEKYFGGRCPDPEGIESHAGHDWPAIARGAVEGAIAKADRMDLAGALQEGIGLVRKVDGYINQTEPFKLAKKIGEDGGGKKRELGAILYHCAEALRIASLILSPCVPGAMARLWDLWGCAPPTPSSPPPSAGSGDRARGEHAPGTQSGGMGGEDAGSRLTLSQLAAWGCGEGGRGLKPGTVISKGETGLFMRADPAEAPPASAEPE